MRKLLDELPASEIECAPWNLWIQPLQAEQQLRKKFENYSEKDAKLFTNKEAIAAYPWLKSVLDRPSVPGGC